MTIVAHKIQLLPNNRQAGYFQKACGVARFSWNWALAEWERRYQAQSPRIVDDFGIVAGYSKRKPMDDYGHLIPPPNGMALKKEFSAQIDDAWPWMRETTSYAYQRVFTELEQAYKRFWKGLAERPTYKAKGKAHDSFYLANTCIKVDGRHVTIQKLGAVRMRDTLRFEGKIMSARVSRDADRWLISIAVEMPDQAPPIHKQIDVAVGVDVGVKAMAALSTGELRENPKAIQQHEKKLLRLQRKLSRQMECAKLQAGIAKDQPIPRGTRIERSKRMLETQRRMQRVHEEITGIRSNAQHQLTAELTKRFGVVAIEDLNVKGMTASAKGDVAKPGRQVKQKSGLNRSILDVGFGELRRQLEYKAQRTGARLVAIDRWSPSSKTCSACGAVKADMTLAIREWDCPECGTHHDRDINAAKNIKALGIQMLKAGIPAKEIKHTGRMNPVKCKSVSASAESTPGAGETEARGADSQ